jgi:hypothetical protein
MAEGGHSDGGFTTGGEEVAAGERTIPCIPNVDIHPQGPWHCTSVIHCGVVGRAKGLRATIPQNVQSALPQGQCILVEQTPLFLPSAGSSWL